MGRGPIAQASVEIIRLIGKAIVGGGDSRTTSKLSRAERKTQGATESARADRELFAGLCVVGGICLLIVCLFSFQASGGGKPSQPIEALQISDAAAVRAALFGATPVLIECTTPRVSGRNLMREAAAEQLLPDSIRLISLDCAPRLLEHFNLPAPQRAPLLLQAGHGMSAPQVVARHTTTQSLVRHLSRWASPAVPILNSTLDLRRHCLSRTVCLVLLTSGVSKHLSQEGRPCGSGEVAPRARGGDAQPQDAHGVVHRSAARDEQACPSRAAKHRRCQRPWR